MKNSFLYVFVLVFLFASCFESKAENSNLNFYSDINRSTYEQGRYGLCGGLIWSVCGVAFPFAFSYGFKNHLEMRDLYLAPVTVPFCGVAGIVVGPGLACMGIYELFRSTYAVMDQGPFFSWECVGEGIKLIGDRKCK